MIRIIAACVLLFSCSTEVENSSPNKISEKTTIQKPEVLEELFSLDNAKKRLAGSSKKGLIYFWSNYDVNCHKLDKEFIKTDRFKSLIQNKYIPFQASLDQGTVINEDGVKVQGKYMKLMIEHFKNEGTPFFVVIDEEANTIKELVAHPRKLDELIEFLKETD
jgi:thioredoxin-related protein